MPISLKNLIGPGQSIEIGECVMLQDQPEPIIELDGMTFLKSGNVLVGEEAEYSEAYKGFSSISQGQDFRNLQWLNVTPSPTGRLREVVSGNGKFLATYRYDGLAYVWSPEAGWTDISGQIASLGVIRDGLYFLGGEFVISGNGDKLFTSKNGLDWDVIEEVPYTTSLAYGNGEYMGTSGNSHRLWRSSDMVSWVDQGNPLYSGYMSKVFFAGGKWFCIGNDYSAVSDDGDVWEQILGMGSGSIRDIAYAGGVWLASTSNSIRVSSDGINWTQLSTTVRDGTFHLLGDQIIHIKYQGGVTTAISDDGGETWESYPLPLDTSFASNDNINMSVGEGYAMVVTGKIGHTAYIAPLEQALGLQTLIQEGQSTQYMRIK